ncbi:MAG: hypothetical protein JXR91_01320 [Deltaproteobacteria bacterium]|nr:hypothetical protein [Deltaproteobacteria bacterium]
MSDNRRITSKNESKKAKKIALKSIIRPKEVKVENQENGNIKKKSENDSYRVNPFYLFIVTLSLIIAAGALTYHLHVRFEGIRLGYEASKVRQEQTRLMLKRRELRLELASMKDPGIIEDEARDKLKMEPPGFDKIISVNKKQKIVSVSGGAL